MSQIQPRDIMLLLLHLCLTVNLEFLSQFSFNYVPKSTPGHNAALFMSRCQLRICISNFTLIMSRSQLRDIMLLYLCPAVNLEFVSQISFNLCPEVNSGT